ncbi:MAG: MFS transporter [Acholeplasmataceae bacterium]|nr:MFS transporter [Acholeplasmataceae bacterium]
MKKLILKINKYFYYGWVIVLISSLAHFMSAPGQTYSISVFINAYQKDFVYSSTLMSTAYSVATVISGLLLIFMGRAIDKYGQRKMMIIVGLLLAVTTFYNSFVSSILMISFGFFMLRYFGQGSMTLLPNSLVPQWFEKKRALAISLSGIGNLIAMLIVPSFNLWMINQYGWPTAWRIWSIILLVGFIPLIFLFVGNQPEDYGLSVENEKHEDEKALKLSQEKIIRESFTLKEALKTRPFWFAGFISMLPAMVSTGLTFHFFNIMDLRMVSETQSAMIIGLLAFPAFFIPFIAKTVIDGLPIKYVLSSTSLMVILSLVFLMFGVSGSVTAIVFILFYGLAIAIQSVTMNVLWANYFGRKHLGSIRSVATVFMVIGSALGPLPFGLSYDLTDNYNVAIFGNIVFAGVALVLSFFIYKPKRDLNK